MKGKRIWSGLLALVFCLGLLPATALAAAEGSEKHTDHTEWTALKEDVLKEKEYQLEDGQYYFSGTEYEYGELVIETSSVLTVTGNVTLCLNNVSYTYTGNNESAVVVEENASLTICCCQPGQYSDYAGSIHAPNAKYVINNGGTLRITGGEVYSNVEYGAPVYNAGACTVSGGNLYGNAGNPLGGYKTAYGIYNADEASLTITGAPTIEGKAPGEMDDPTGPQIDVLTYDTICVEDLSDDFWGFNIGFYGEAGTTVVSGVTGDPDDWTGTWYLFTLAYPENAVFTYNQPMDGNPGTLVYEGSSSMAFAGAPMIDGYYTVETEEIPASEDGGTSAYTSVKLVKSDEDDYTVHWDENSKNLTLRNAEISLDGDALSDAVLFDMSDTDQLLTVSLEGENTVNITSRKDSTTEVGAFSNKSGIAVSGTGSLTVNFTVEDGWGNVAAMTAFAAEGSFENHAALTVTATNQSEKRNCQKTTGISAECFTNDGTLAIHISGKESDPQAVAVDLSAGRQAGAFTNGAEARFDVTIEGAGTGTGVLCQAFENCGTMDINIDVSGSAVGVVGYENAGNWANQGSVTISVGNSGVGAGAIGGGALAGVDWRSGSVFDFTKSGTLTVTAKRAEASTQSNTNWPTWQYFDTMGVCLMPNGESKIINTGEMTLTAKNGYTAGMMVSGSDEDIHIQNKGTMSLVATTMGGANIRAVALFAQIPNITGGDAKTLQLDLENGTLNAKAEPVSEYENNVIENGCMAICLSQRLTKQPTAPAELQQIDTEGSNLSGTPVVSGPIQQADGYWAYINTIGSVDEAGNVTADSGVTAKPQFPGSVTLEGTAQVGGTLTAQVTGTPEGVQLCYQWQSADSIGGPYSTIAGANGATYTLTSQEAGKYIRVSVTDGSGAYGGSLIATMDSAVSTPSSGGSSRPTYPPTVTDTAGGDTSVAPARPHKGDTVTITPKPDQGNEVDSVTVTDRNGDPVKVTDKGDGTYTFTQPTGKVTISVTFRDKETPGLPFVDVAPDTWYFDAVRYAYENSLMVGTSPTAFSPNGMTTRAQIVTILWRLVDSPAGEAPVDFADVDPAAWYGEAVRWAAGQGIVGGYGNGSFGPNDPVTREQLAAILYRFAQHMGYDTEGQADLSGFTDLTQVSTYAREAMAWCVDAGLLSGTSPTTLSPRGQATRAQTAAVLMRLCQGYGM